MLQSERYENDADNNAERFMVYVMIVISRRKETEMENRLTAYGNYLAGTEKADNTTALYIREAAAFIYVRFVFCTILIKPAMN